MCACVSLVFACLTLWQSSFSALPPDRDAAQPGPPDVGAAHESPPLLPWMPASTLVRESLLAQAAADCDGPSHVIRDGYRSIQVNVDQYGCNISGDAANEPSIAIDPTDSRKIVIGWRQFDTIESDFRQAGYAYSHDAGHTWIFPGSLTPGIFGSDPVLDADAEGVIYYLSANFEELRLFRTWNGGVTWLQPVRAIAELFDKPWLTIDRTGGSGHGNVYIAGNGSPASFLRSVNGGTSFDHYGPDFPGGAPTVDVGGDGTVFMVDGNRVTWSTTAKDAGKTPSFGPLIEIPLGRSPDHGGPNPGGLGGQTWVAAEYLESSPSAILYVLASTHEEALFLKQNVTFARSEDGGIAWSLPVRVNDDPIDNGAWHWFAMMSVAPNGRIDAVWNDTRNYTDAPEANLCELYYSYSTDAGDNWSSNIPVSPVFDSHVGWPVNQSKLGDYYHMLSDNLGVNVAYAATFNGEQDVYFLRIGPWDCNGNEIPDEDDIAKTTSLDCNANEVPDECEYRGDFDGDRLTTLRDLAAFQNCFTGSTLEMMVREGIHAPANRDATVAPGINPDATSGTRPIKPITARTETLPEPCCGLFDLEPDGDVDSADLAVIQRVLSGP